MTSEGVRRVLLVEDNLADARLLEELLLEEDPDGYEVVFAKRLDEAFLKVRTEIIDVVLLDLSLPDAHGVDTVARMREAARDIPVVVMTGNSERSAAVEMLARGAQDYLVKGRVDGATVARAIAYAIARSRVDDAQRRLAIEKAARDEAEVAEKRARYLAEAGRALAATLDYEETMRTAARLGVGDLGDYCLIDLVSGEKLRRVATAHADAATESVAALLAAHPPARKNASHPVTRAITTMRSVLVDDVPRVIASLPDREHAAVATRLGGRCALSVPLVAREQVLGAITFVSSSDYRYAGANRALAEELAARVSIALDNGLLYAAAQQAAAARDETIAVVSHDLRTPLSLVGLALKRLHRTDGDSATRDELLHRGQRAVDTMARLINDLLDVARVDAGTLVVHGAPCTPIDLVQDTVELHRPLAVEKGIALTTKIAVNLPSVIVERGRILQVFANLLGNALKFTPSGGSIEVRAESEALGAVRFSVRDTGVGIPEEHLSKVFERFWRPRNEESAGAGLGLAIVKGIIEAHGGRLSVESRVGQGATFSFTVPAVPLPSMVVATVIA